MGSGPVPDGDSYEAVRSRVGAVFDLAARFPDRTFRTRQSPTVFVEFEALFFPDFWPALRSLPLLHGDEVVDLLVLEPDAHSYYLPHTGMHPAVTVPVGSSADDYWDAVSAPTSSGDDANALVYSANVVAVTGRSRRWGFWGERDTGVAAIRGMPTGSDFHAWVARFAPLLPVVDALEEYIEPYFGYRRRIPDDFASPLKINYP